MIRFNNRRFIYGLFAGYTSQWIGMSIVSYSMVLAVSVSVISMFAILLALLYLDYIVTEKIFKKKIELKGD